MNPRNPHSWHDRAACRDEDPERFFPAGTTGPSAADIRVAKFVCGQCPVKGACLQWAFGNDERYGIWGGLTEWERRAVKGQEAPADEEAAA
jgi:WhiB family redox-sensing transcriptional regulator